MTRIPPACKLWRRDHWSPFRIQRARDDTIRLIAACCGMA